MRHYPQENQWYIGLFLLDPAWRGRRLGRAGYLAFEDWVRRRNAELLQLAVVECNERAAKFWQSLGFVLPRCHATTRLGLKQHVLIEFEKPLAPLETGGPAL